MPKSIVIEPEQAFARSTIHFTDIEVNAYQKTAEEELGILDRGFSAYLAGHVRDP